MVVGIPKALLYFRYSVLWKSFFKNLGIEYIESPDTNREIIRRGTGLAVDESCLSFKVYCGHVDWLMEKCDAILVPRISDFGKAGTVCTRFQAVYDVLTNTYRDNAQRFLNYNVDLRNSESELKAFIKLGRELGIGRSRSILAYLAAKQAERKANEKDVAEQRKLLKEDVIKILVISHCYNALDDYIGGAVFRALRENGAVPILGSAFCTKEALAESLHLSDTVPWLFSRELLGAVALYQDRADGIILMTAFPCGPDSLVNELIVRKIKDKPILNLILDGQEATAGLETRIESFMDIIRFKKEDLKWTEQE
jgi:predicted nucleotide-binding protein (sugar kinase/HSP70/actin superfamily)